MKIRIISVGRLKVGPERDLFSHYLTRLETAARRAGLSGIENVELSESRAPRARQRQSEEARLIEGKLRGDGFIVALDEKGRSFNSMAFADALTGWRADNRAVVQFILGGPDGLQAEFKAGADLKLALSAMTLPHGLARIVLAEQLYRAALIAVGHPYHRA